MHVNRKGIEQCFSLKTEWNIQEIQLQKPYQTVASEKYAGHITDICNPLIWRHAGSPAFGN